MRYVCLIYSSEAHPDEPGPEEHERVNERYAALERELTASGRIVGGAELRPAATATTVRVRHGEVLVTDGPFAETREQLGGFLVLECQSADEAVEVARRIPAAGQGAVEVRPQHTRAAS